MAIPSTVLRATPDALATPSSAAFMRAYNSKAVTNLSYASSQVDKALHSSVGGWGTAPQLQVDRAIGAIPTVEALRSVEAGQASQFASELLRNTRAARQGNAYEVLDFRRTALLQARDALNGAAQRETMARFAL